MSNHAPAEGRIWSQAEQGHLMHAFATSDGSAYCRSNVLARLWMPTRQPTFNTITEAYYKPCSKCLDRAGDY